jgi:hypothetical protein
MGFGHRVMGQEMLAHQPDAAFDCAHDGLVIEL